jgi:hypothetical protein
VSKIRAKKLAVADSICQHGSCTYSRGTHAIPGADVVCILHRAVARACKVVGGACLPGHGADFSSRARQPRERQNSRRRGERGWRESEWPGGEPLCENLWVRRAVSNRQAGSVCLPACRLSRGRRGIEGSGAGRQMAR